MMINHERRIVLIISVCTIVGIISSVMASDWKFEPRSEMDEVIAITHLTLVSVLCCAQNYNSIQKILIMKTRRSPI